MLYSETFQENDLKIQQIILLNVANFSKMEKPLELNLREALITVVITSSVPQEVQHCLVFPGILK